MNPLTLMKEDAPPREHSLRELFNGLRWFVRAGCPWRMMPNDLPPWHAVQQQTQRWLRAGRAAAPSAAILDSRTLQSSHFLAVAPLPTRFPSPTDSLRKSIIANTFC